MAALEGTERARGGAWDVAFGEVDVGGEQG